MTDAVTARYALYSAGGHARETHGALRAMLQARGAPSADILFIDDDAALHGQLLHGSRVVSYADARALGSLQVCVAFGSSALRRRAQQACLRDGIPVFSIVAATAIVGGNVTIGEGAIVSHNAMLTCDVSVGAGFQCNMYAYVAHDCTIGDFVTLAPRASVNGRVRIEDDVFIGAGAIILPGNAARPLTIGRGASVGAGAVVTRDVAPGSTVIGCPARPMTR